MITPMLAAVCPGCRRKQSRGFLLKPMPRKLRTLHTGLGACIANRARLMTTKTPLLMRSSLQCRKESDQNWSERPINNKLINALKQVNFSSEFLDMKRMRDHFIDCLSYDDSEKSTGWAAICYGGTKGTGRAV